MLPAAARAAETPTAAAAALTAEGAAYLLRTNKGWLTH